jgi:quinol monooxygenase YgiN
MATFLAHITVRAGREADFERIVADLYDATHAKEPGARRYEYWRGAAEGTYYTHASFADFLAFIEHQTSDHHESAGPPLEDVLESIRFEWVDPISRASPLVTTEPRSAPDDASAVARKYHERFAVEVQPWWVALRAD